MYNSLNVHLYVQSMVNGLNLNVILIDKVANIFYNDLRMY